MDGAALNARLAARLTEALGDEAGLPRGAVMPLATSPGVGTSKIESALKTLRGKLITMEDPTPIAGLGY